MSYGLHGRKRVKEGEIPEEVREQWRVKEGKEVEEYKGWNEEYFNWKEKEKKGLDNSNSSEDWERVLELTQRLLLKNPDFYTAWNDRRVILTKLLVGKDLSDRELRYQEELNLVQGTLKLRPKTYWCWNHRGWSLSKLNLTSYWVKELGLTSYLLDLDNRNFHGWDYRRRVLGELLVRGETSEDQEKGLNFNTTSPELVSEYLLRNQSNNQSESLKELLVEELVYTEKKLQQSFSNGSAWHYRSCLLRALLTYQSSQLNIITTTSPSSVEDNFLSYEKEQTLVKNAFYTDPEDQSAWFYYRWLINSPLVPSPPLPTPPLPQAYLVKKPITQLPLFRNLPDLDDDQSYELTLTFPSRVSLDSNPQVMIKSNGEEKEGQVQMVSQWVVPSTTTTGTTPGITLPSRVWSCYFLLPPTTTTTTTLDLHFDLATVTDPSLPTSSPPTPTGTVTFHTPLPTPPNSPYHPLQRHFHPPAVPSSSPDWEPTHQQRVHFLTKELEELSELVDLEPTAKWPLLTLAYLTRTLLLTTLPSSSSPDVVPTTTTHHHHHSQQLRHTLTTLLHLDPLRTHYYRAQLHQLPPTP